MSSPPHSYHFPNQNLIYYESGSNPPVARQSHSPGPSWMPSAMTDDQSSYSQSYQVGNPFDVEGMNYPFNHPQADYSIQGTSFQDSGAGPSAVYNDNAFNFPSFPFSNHPEFHDRFHSYPFYESSHGLAGQPYVNNAFQMDDTAHTLSVHHPQAAYTPQTSNGPPVSVYEYSSTQLPLVDGGRVGFVDGAEAGPARPTTEGLKLDTFGTANVELPDTGEHSHPSPVANSFYNYNQTQAAGPSRTLPSSPERKRLLPLSADEDPSTARKVIPRSNRAWSVHSASSDSHRRGRPLDIVGRGPEIPQDRYTTSSVSSFNAADRGVITFDLENPNEVGIPITDILNKTGSFHRIRDRAQAFNHMGKKTFTLRVQWPGYKPWSKTIAALNWKKYRAPITRVKLAEDVATSIRDFLRKKRDETCDSEYAQWNVGPNGIQLEQLCLVALYHVSKGSWQPQLCLLHPRQH